MRVDDKGRGRLGAGVEEVEVDLAAGTVTTTGTPSEQAVTQAISEAGYDVVSAESLPVSGNALPLVGSAGGCGCGCG